MSAQRAAIDTGSSEPGLVGDWTADGIGRGSDTLLRQIRARSGQQINASGMNGCDTAGALIIAQGMRAGVTFTDLRPETARFIDLVSGAMPDGTVVRRSQNGLMSVLTRIGKGIQSYLQEAVAGLDFLGRLMTSSGRLLIDPRRFRLAPVVSLAQRAGFDALPVVAVTTFFIGAVVGLLGANLLRDFGAQIFSVELIGVAVLREFNILITALLLAGRSASSFTAEIGSMKMNQEIDAMRVMGLDPFETLVIPRFLALLLTVPLLTFVATLAGLLGGQVVTWLVLDLSPITFVQRLVDYVGATHFWIGMSKAPVMAAIVAVIGCRQGLRVEGDVESLGRRVTASVVQCIFAIIVIDAIFALIYMELDL